MVVRRKILGDMPVKDGFKMGLAALDTLELLAALIEPVFAISGGGAMVCREKIFGHGAPSLAGGGRFGKVCIIFLLLW